jgi:hypothetical protein
MVQWGGINATRTLGTATVELLSPREELYTVLASIHPALFSCLLSFPFPLLLSPSIHLSAGV